MNIDSVAMTNTEGSKPGPHLHQPPTLAALAELHAREAHEMLTTVLTTVRRADDWQRRVTAAEAHAAVARACAHAAIAARPAYHRPAR